MEWHDLITLPDPVESDLSPLESAQAGGLKRPENRSFHNMAYDSRRGVVVLHGGGNSSFTVLRDTWEYDGTAWKRVNTVGPVRYVHSMAYDANRGVTVLFGGRNTGSGDPLSETWEWDGQAWRELDVPLKPKSVIFGDMVFDDNRGKIVYFGGMPWFMVDLSSDTWEYSSSTSHVEQWRQHDPR